MDQGSLLFRIDSLDYDLAIARGEAAVESANADLQELAQSERNTGALLAIEKRTLELAQAEFERQKGLADRGTASRAAADSAERDMNLREGAVRELSNALALMPAQRAVLEAKLAQAEADLRLARLDLERTVVTAPFTGRVTEESLSVGQVIAAGEALVTLDGLAAAEIEAEIPVAKLMPLFQIEESLGLQGVSAERVATYLEEAGLKATVRFLGGLTPIEWEGRVARIRGTLDPVARTVGIVVIVENPYSEARPGERPPLVSGMYVEVELAGRPREGVVAVPRAAVLNGTVLIADAEDRLRRKPVTIAYRQGDLVLLNADLPMDARIVVSDLSPAIDGMKLAPVLDAEAARALQDQATGFGSVR